MIARNRILYLSLLDPLLMGKQTTFVGTKRDSCSDAKGKKIYRFFF